LAPAPLETGLLAGVMSDHIVVGERVLLHTGFRAARNRLEMLLRAGTLLGAAEAAYGSSITQLVAMAGPEAGLTRLADVHVDDLAETPGCAHSPVRWTAIAADGTLFTALDADLMLVSASRQVTALALAGAYRTQPGPGGTELALAAARECGAIAVGRFLHQVEGALSHPAGAARAGGRSPL